MKTIEYIKGDATSPQAKGNKIIAHVCNDCGGWGKGFVLAISKRWKQPEAEYREWYKSREEFALGNTRLVKCQDYLWVANMIAQNGIKVSKVKGPPIRYDSLKKCLVQLRELAIEKKASVHMPRIGCGLAGGKWERVEPIIIEELSSHEIEVTVYDF